VDRERLVCGVRMFVRPHTHFVFSLGSFIMTLAGKTFVYSQNVSCLK